MRSLPRSRMSGLSLVELMIAMTLGLVLMAGVASVFVSTGRINRTNENLSRLQESARTAFSLLTRDLREAGLNDCGRITRVANALNTTAATPWLNWNGGIVGFEQGVAVPGVVSGGGVGQRDNTQDAVRVMKGAPGGVTIVNHNPAAAIATMTLTDTGNFVAGDLLVACDFAQATIFQATAIPAARTVQHLGIGAAPGNCTALLGWPLACPAAGRSYPYAPNSALMRFESTVWYIGSNGRAASGGTSLFRQTLRSGGNPLAPAVEEVLEGVTALQLQYLVAGAANYVNAAAVADWTTVLAVRVTLTLAGVNQERNATDNRERVQRTFSNIVTLRNRVS